MIHYPQGPKAFNKALNNLILMQQGDDKATQTVLSDMGLDWDSEARSMVMDKYEWAIRYAVLGEVVFRARANRTELDQDTLSNLCDMKFRKIMKEKGIDID